MPPPNGAPTIPTQEQEPTIVQALNLNAHSVDVINVHFLILQRAEAQQPDQTDRFFHSQGAGGFINRNCVEVFEINICPVFHGAYDVCVSM